MPWSNKALVEALHYSGISSVSRTAISADINDSESGHKCRHEPRQECVQQSAENHVESPFHPTSREILSVKNMSDSLDKLDSSRHPI